MSLKNLTTNHFHTPPTIYRPWTRWWWPGGAVEHDELLREVRLFADTFFGGVEIQAFTAGMNPQTLKNENSPVYDYDSPAYYAKLVAVLEEAQAQGIQVDLTMGSGWPAGGDFVPLDDNTDTLLYGEATISRAVDMPVPPPQMPFAYAIYSANSVLPLLHGREWVRALTYHPEKARLVSVVAAKITQNGRSPDPSILTDTLHLDPATAVDLSSFVSDGHLRWQPPSSGDWQIVALYTMPSGSNQLITAVRGESYVVDPFDSAAIGRFYDNWLGKHPDLLAHAGAALRGLFSDSYEFFAQRFFADDLIELFRTNRGYDPTPFLPAVFQPAADQFFFFFSGLRSAPDFSFGDISQRIIHDYNHTVSDLFFKHWYPTSREWVESNNLQFRQQGYNPPLDILKAAGAASIPETEGGDELMLKRVASGGHLYGRPIISAEAFVFFPQGGFALSPQDYKQGIDTLMTAGVNQIVYHGTPYRWDEPGYGEIGWSPFSTPYGGNISTTIGEADSFWKFQPDINRYAARLQFLLQQGQPDADWLVYLPLFAEPTAPNFKPVITTLNTQGRAWEWVNEEKIAEAEWTDAGLKIGTMSFQGIILAECPALPLDAAQKLAELAQAGTPIVIYGNPPAQQPGYLNYVENDRAVQQHVQAILGQSQSAHISDESGLAAFIRALPTGKIHYEPNESLRFIRRDLGEGAYLAFVRSDQPTAFTLNFDADLGYGYWLDAVTGKIYRAESGDGWLSGSIAFIGSPQAIFADQDLAAGDPIVEPTVAQTIALADWTLTVDSADFAGDLGDWSQRDDLRYTASPGVYTTTINLSEILLNVRYILDLGVVASAAEVQVNGQDAGAAIFAPYQVEITDFVVVGENSIVVTVTPALHNRLLGKALSGDREYAQFRGGFFGPTQPRPAGLIGPVTLKIG